MKQNKQPKGMYVLAFTEIFERMSYYTLSFLLVLYASAETTKGGLGWTTEHALSLMGFYTFAAYTLPLVGGFITDKLFGTLRATIFGALLIITGHICMLFSSDTNLFVFYMALIFVATGTGFFKPNMPTLLGRLYTPSDTGRDAGFKLYYMGINIGSMLAGIISGLLLQKFGYHIALGSAGIGMMLGLAVFLAGKKHLNTNESLAALANTTTNATPHTSAIYRKSVLYLIISIVFVAVWAISYNIAISGTLSIYIENFTQKIVLNYNIPTTFFLSLESIGIVIAAPLFAYLFQKLAKNKKSFHFFSQMNLAMFIIFAAIAYFTYLSHVVTHEIPAGAKPFHWLGISIFILAISVSEVLISPVAMSAISLLSPVRSRSFFQALYLSATGITGIIASKVGVISLTHPFEAFFAVSAVTFVAFIIFCLLRKRMVTVANEVAEYEERLQLNIRK